MRHAYHVITVLETVFELLRLAGLNRPALIFSAYVLLLKDSHVQVRADGTQECSAQDDKVPEAGHPSKIL